MKAKLVLFCMVSSMAVSSIYSTQLVQSDIFYEIAHDNKKAVKSWLKSAPDLSVKNAQGQTVLTAAVLTGQCDLAKMFVKAGINVNATDLEGKTALDHAVESGYEKIIFYLVKAKAQVAKSDNLIEIKAIISAYNKKIMRRFFIILPILLVLAVPAFLSVLLCMMSGSMASLGLSICSTLSFFGYPATALYALALSVQACVWVNRSRKITILERIN